MSNINVETVSPIITVQRVEDDKRMDFLPMAFGAHYLQGEHLVFSWLRELSDDYQGGYWHGPTISSTVKCLPMRLASWPRSMG
jgi:hypothetical protein